ncbi:uncharacterized protein BDR25DRAFT_362682 [Lindgomyces ingoldianus]|uniref:Uncharacterized protein n=1 Tax=Lindgomyces ingoldianus TaxID=673940 RepID=A0ACB6QAG0_9PLEO|nr:uncharacterized protein BDR25DRAFT_362682 [Lindgomyces ingoldianus]KAF2463510.1 hypothetical protein BDR25DRAFT_362682 [Lindgomyces ingoldianus]
MRPRYKVINLLSREEFLMTSVMKKDMWRPCGKGLRWRADTPELPGLSKLDQGYSSSLNIMSQIFEPVSRQHQGILVASTVYFGYDPTKEMETRKRHGLSESFSDQRGYYDQSLRGVSCTEMEDLTFSTTTWLPLLCTSSAARIPSSFLSMLYRSLFAIPLFLNMFKVQPAYACEALYIIKSHAGVVEDGNVAEEDSRYTSHGQSLSCANIGALRNELVIQTMTLRVTGKLCSMHYSRPPFALLILTRIDNSGSNGQLAKEYIRSIAEQIANSRSALTVSLGATNSPFLDMSFALMWTKSDPWPAVMLNCFRNNTPTPSFITSSETFPPSVLQKAVSSQFSTDLSRRIPVAEPQPKLSCNPFPAHLGAQSQPEGTPLEKLILYLDISSPRPRTFTVATPLPFNPNSTYDTPTLFSKVTVEVPFW